MKKILLAEDEPIILKFVSFRLEGLGYEIYKASDGAEALKLIKKHRPDLILLDVLMPGMDGYEVCRRVRMDKKLKHIPVILFTASDPTIVTAKVKEVGADDYIIKPFEPDSLLEKIQKYIG